MQDTDFLTHYDEVKCKKLNTLGFNFFDYLHASGSPLDALFYSRLFWPEFIEVNDMVFLKETVEDKSDKARIEEAFNIYDGEKTLTEQSFNTIEVPSLFGKNLGETSDQEDLMIAQRLSEMWQYKLQSDYPNRKFIVKVLSADDSDNEVSVSFYTNR